MPAVASRFTSKGSSKQRTIIHQPPMTMEAYKAPEKKKQQTTLVIILSNVAHTSQQLVIKMKFKNA